jgi:hypothetical protein
LVGEVCPDASPEVVMCSGTERNAHVFAVPEASGFTSAHVSAVDSINVKLLSTSCSAGPGQGCDSLGAGAIKAYAVAGGALLAVGATGLGCAQYEVTFGP